MKSIKLTIAVTIALAGIGIWMLGYLSGKYIERQDQLLTPDSRYFLHGCKLDLPEELVARDSTYILSIRVNNTIQQQIINK